MVSMEEGLPKTWLIAQVCAALRRPLLLKLCELLASASNDEEGQRLY